MNSKSEVDVVVIGSTNTDMVIQTEEMPKPGETVLGGDFLMNQGGKGANQAVAAVRLGASVAFVGKIGKDVFGSNTLDYLKKEGLMVDFVFKDSHTPSGVATITLDKNGQNSIVVAPGSNANLSLEDIKNAKGLMESSKVVLLQLEIPVNTVLYAAKLGFQLNNKIILNPAPFVAIPDEIYSYLHIITPNESEAESLTGINILNTDQAEKAALILKNKGIPIVIITMGAEGAYVLSDEFSGLVPTEIVKVLDTTAAGDTFNGALAVAISHNIPLYEAVVFANKAASLSVTKMGAQSSCPYLNELSEFQN